MSYVEPKPVVGATTKPVKFLIVDDDKVSVLAIKRALRKLKIVNPVEVARDGREALDILRGEKEKAKIMPPYLITLDLNMPRMDGFEFLEEVRKDDALSSALIFVLTTSDAPVDVAHAYEKNIAGYIVKDNVSDSFIQALDMIDSYARIIEFPS